MVKLPSADIVEFCTFAVDLERSMTMINTHTLGILDDEPLILAALNSELSNFYDIRFSCLREKDFLEQLKKDQPELVLLDILLGDSNGVETACYLRETYPDIKILVLSIDTRRETFRRLLEIGIDGFVSKKASTSEIVHAVDVVIRGEKYYGKDSFRLIKDIQTSMLEGHEPVLTQLEVDLLYACCEGKSSADIGEALHMSSRTVEAHKSTLFVKLAVNSTAELIVKAIQRGIVTL